MAQTDIKRNIFIAVDGSEHSDRACEWYIENIWREGDCAIVFYAQSMPSIPASPYPFGFHVEEVNELIHKEHKKAQHVLEVYAKKLKKHQINFKLVTERAKNVGEVLVKNIKEEKCSSVVIGSRGMSALGRLLMGSVSTYVVHEVDVPVVVVPPDVFQ